MEPGGGSSRCANPDVCHWGGGSSRSPAWHPLAELLGGKGGSTLEMSLFVLAGSPLLLVASVAPERFRFSETFPSVELSLWQGEERRSNFNNLIKYIM